MSLRKLVRPLRPQMRDVRMDTSAGIIRLEILPLLNLGMFHIAAHVNKQIVSTKWEIATIANAKNRRNIRKDEKNLG